MLTTKTVVLVDELGASIDNILAKKMLTTLLRFLSDSKYSNIQANEQLTAITDKFEIPLTIVITHLTDAMTGSLISEQYLLRYLTMDLERD